MKLEDRKVDTQGNLTYRRKVKMEIDPGSMRIIIDALTKGLYGDPYTVVLREYTSNALDAHKDAGVNRAVEVTLPTSFNPNLVIQDFGTGMDEETMDKFCQYGWSTKRDSNESIGAFGLGSKSGLAVATSFTVRSVKDGILNVMVVTLGEQGPEGGFITEAKPVDEPNGTKITIPTSEVHQFRKAVDHGMFKGYKPGTIKINGEEPLSIWSAKSGWTPIMDLDAAGNATDTVLGWKTDSKVGGYGRTQALVGAVLYSVEWEKGYPELSGLLKEGYLSHVALNLPNGEVTLPRNREGITYDGRTRRVIRELTDKIVAQAKTLYDLEIDGAASVRDAYRIKLKAEKFGFTGDYTYKGTPLKLDPRQGQDFSISRATLTQVHVDSYADGTKISSRAALRTDDLSLPNIIAGIVQSEVSILVVEAGELGTSGVNIHKHAISSQSSMFVRSERGTTPGFMEARLYFTSLTLDQIDKFLPSLFTRVMTGAEFLDQAAVYRKAVMANARKNGSGSSGAPKEAVRVIEWIRRGVPGSLVETDVADLDDNVKYVLLKRGDSHLVNSVIRVLTTKVGFSESYYLREVLQAIAAEGYVFLQANKSWDTEKYAEWVPNLTSLDEAWQATRASRSVKVTTEQKIAAEARNGYKNQWAMGWTQKYMDAIRKPETKAWIEAIQQDSFDSHVKFIQACNLAGFDTTGMLTYDVDPTPEQYAWGERYPLLRPNYGRVMGHDTVTYINLMDIHLDTPLY